MTDIKYHLFEAVVDENDNLKLDVNIPGGIEIKVTQANLLELLTAFSEIIYFCSSLQRNALLDVLGAKMGSNDKPDSTKEDVH